MRSWLMIFGIIICRPSAYADILAVSGYEGQQNIQAIAELVEPLELKTTGTPGWDPVIEGVIERFPSRPGRGPTTMQVRFFDLADNRQTESVSVEATWFMARNEPDTLRDLGLLFGWPQEGVRVGSRRHVQALVTILSGEGTAQDLLRFEGAGLRWVQGKRYSEEDLLQFERVGGTWQEFPGSQAFELPLGELVAIVAADRRYPYLEPGFERAAISLLRGWIQGCLEGAERDPDKEQIFRAEVSRALGAAIGAIGRAAPGAINPYDPDDVRSAYETWRDAGTEAERDAARVELAASIAAHAGGERDGRTNVLDPISAVDPSEVALVWIDTIRAMGAFATNAPVVEEALMPLPGVLLAHCGAPDAPDPRRNDRNNLWPHIEQLADELFDPEHGEETPFRTQVFESLWTGLLRQTGRSVAQAEREVSLLFAAGWSTPSTIDQRAEELMLRLKQLAGRLADREKLAQRAQTDDRAADLEKYRNDIEKNTEWLDAHLTIARAMSTARASNGVDPAAAFARQVDALKKDVREARAEAARRPANQSVSPSVLGWELLLAKLEAEA